MNKVLVTGATGFIGRCIIERLLHEGFTVIATSSNKHSASAKSWFKNVTFIPFDLKTFDDKVNYFDFFKKPDILIHLAWEGLPNYGEDFHISENLPRHFAFLKNMVINGLKNINVTGT
ncbi:MAG: SDR family NAD(P)-dependent oxidoreductase, partial [Ferruginibacter sp.]